MTTKFIKVFSILAMMSISLLLFGIANGAGCNYKWKVSMSKMGEHTREVVSKEF
ncbi:hypothetical protein [Aeromonas sp. NJAU223]|uniref:hypothetical protein n=1 Tax=Aeromonas sp. NJAU223 TaxID=3115650 RepID=UPI003DA852AE